MLETEEIYPGGYPPKKNRLWKKIKDKMEQVRADVFKEKPIHWFSILLWGLVFLCAFIVMKSCSDPEAVPAGGCYAAVEETMPEVGDSVPETFFDEVYDYIFKLRIDHPDIVMAQCIEESGGFTSKLFVEGHNCLGMKVPGSRPTLAVGTMLGHARFNSWRECIADYAIWQSTFARRLTKDEYFAYLDRVYAEKKGYSGRLKAIIQSRGL